MIARICDICGDNISNSVNSFNIKYKAEHFIFKKYLESIDVCPWCACKIKDLSKHYKDNNCKFHVQQKVKVDDIHTYEPLTITDISERPWLYDETTGESHYAIEVVDEFMQSFIVNENRVHSYSKE